MARTTVQALTDRLLGGNLRTLLTGWDADDISIDQMTRRLETDHDIVVSRETVRRWLNSYKAEAA